LGLACLLVEVGAAWATYNVPPAASIPPLMTIGGVACPAAAVDAPGRNKEGRGAFRKLSHPLVIEQSPRASHSAGGQPVAPFTTEKPAKAVDRFCAALRPGSRWKAGMGPQIGKDRLKVLSITGPAIRSVGIVGTTPFDLMRWPARSRANGRDGCIRDVCRPSTATRPLVSQVPSLSFTGLSAVPVDLERGLGRTGRSNSGSEYSGSRDVE